MIKTLVNSGAYTSGNVPMTVYKNTNDKYQLDTTNNTIDIKTAGLTEIRGNVVVTATASSNLSLQLYADGVAISGALDTQTVESGNTYTFHINDIIRAVNQYLPIYASISMQLSGACTIVGGDLILTYEK